jgi:hypothetical protein
MADQTAGVGINRGLLWGCIAPLIAVTFLIAGWFVYNTYYYTAGYKEAPGLPTVMRAVNASPIAKRILGDDIQIVQMELNMSGGERKGGQRIFYKVLARGTKAQGQIQTSLLIGDNKVDITDLKLISYDGTPYNLLR